MAFNRPTLTELNNRIASDTETRLPGSEPRLRRSLFNVLGRVNAGAIHGLHGHLEYISKQILVSTADSDYLQRHTGIWKVPAKGAGFSIGNIDVQGAGIVPAGEIWQRSDGVEYTVNTETIITGSTSVAVTAVMAGTEGNAVAGVALTSVNVIPGVDSQATVDNDGLTSGADVESEDSNRQRTLTRIQLPPHGGAKHDYEAWALEVPGVTRAWEYPQEMGIGTVTVRFVRDDDDTLIPDAAEVQAVQDYIDDKRPVTAKATYVAAPIAVPLNVTISLTPNNTVVQAAVQAEIEDLLRREAKPEDGNGSGTILISHLREAISIAAGETNHVLVSPVDDVTHTAGQMAVIGVITWQ